MFGYDRQLDPHRHDPAVHYRLYLSPDGEGVVVICVQDFDYRDYEDGRFIGYEAWETEGEAAVALDALRVEALKVLGRWPYPPR